MLAIDTSRSMGATDVKPTRLAAARAAAAARSSSKVPSKFRVGIVAFARARVRRAAADARPRRSSQPALARAAAGRGHRARRRGRARDPARHSGSAPRTATCRRPPSSSSPTAPSNGGRTTPRRPPSARRRRRTCPSTRSSLGTPDGVVQRDATGGFSETIRVPPEPDDAAARSRARPAASSSPRATTRACSDVYEQLGSRLGHKRQAREMTDVFAGGSAAAAARRRRALGALVPEGAVRRVARSSLRRARGGACCRPVPRRRARRTSAAGLLVCVPVAGPWVVVPGRRALPRPQVEYQLSCPRGYIVGGLDAELSDRADRHRVPRHARRPVGPGDHDVAHASSSSRRYVGDARARAELPAAHRLHARRAAAAGAMPTARAQRRPARRADRPPRHARSRVAAGHASSSLAAAARGERLVARLARVGFYTATPPDAGARRAPSRARTRRAAARVAVRSRRRGGRRCRRRRPGRRASARGAR